MTHTDLTQTEIDVLESRFAELTGRTFAGRDELFVEMSAALEETGSCEVPSHLTISGRPELVNRSDLGRQQYRAYDVLTEWSGPVRDSVEAAERDVTSHQQDMARAGGISQALVVTERNGRCYQIDGSPVWPPHGHTSGAARWR